jgi:hypothetical protein
MRKNHTAGRLSFNDSPKMPQGKTPSSVEFERLIATFRRIAAINDPIERDFELGRSARDHGLPRQEIRRFYREWAIAQVQGGAA